VNGTARLCDHAAVVGSGAPASGPEAVRDRADLSHALERLRQRAARGSGRGRASLESIARATGIPRSTVHSYVRGLRLPPPDALDAIVVALGATQAEQAQWAAALERVVDARPSTGAVAPAAVPRQLPARPVGFVGRDRELAQLAAGVERAAASEEAPAVIAVTGIGGVGKTALVLHWAHQARELFPDGQLWLDLRAFSASPALEPADALERLLRAVGIGTAELPADVDARSAIFRSAVAGRRMLLVVDNARDAEHVRPLLPGTFGFVTVVTSRDALRSLVAREGAHRLQLDRLPMDAALRLLSTGLPAPARGAEAERIAARCDGLPLALRIVGERLSRGAEGDLDRIVAELEGSSSSRLAVLELDEPAGGVGMRSVMEWSYRSLPPEAAAVFRRLPQCLAPTFDIDVVRVLIDRDQPTARRLLEQLVAANLLDIAGAGQFRIHDLVAAYAADRLHAEEPADEVAAARLRLLEHLLSAVEAALAVLDPARPPRLPRPAGPAPVVEPFAGIADAKERMLAYTDLLIAAVLDAGQAELFEHCWALAERAFRMAWFLGNMTPMEPAMLAMREAAGRAGSAAAEAIACRMLAMGCAQTARLREAEQYLERAIAIRQAASDDPLALLMDTANLAFVRGTLGDLDDAIATMERFVSDAHGLEAERPSYITLVEFELQRGDVEAARRWADRVLEFPSVRQRVGSFHLEAQVQVAAIELASGELTAARERLERVAQECEALGNLDGLSAALERLAIACHRLGDDGAAESFAREAAAAGWRAGAQSRRFIADATLAEIMVDKGRPAEALALCGDALAWSREATVKYAECRFLVIAARARRDLDDRTAALADAQEALEIAERCGYRLLGAEASQLVHELPTAVGTAAAAAVRESN